MRLAICESKKKERNCEMWEEKLRYVGGVCLCSTSEKVGVGVVCVGSAAQE